MSNPVGRPLRFKTADELQAVVDEYFDWCNNRTKSVFIKDMGDNIEVSNPAPYTMSGLARRIGLSRQALSEYGHRDEFGDTIVEARNRVQEDIETRLMETSNQSGAQFNLKNNFGWKDKSEVEVSGDFKTTEEKIGAFLDDLNDGEDTESTLEEDTE